MPLKTPPGMEKTVPYMGDVWVIGTGVGNVVISVCPSPSHGGQDGVGPRSPRLHLLWVLSQQPRPHVRSQRK